MKSGHFRSNLRKHAGEDFQAPYPHFSEQVCAVLELIRDSRSGKKLEILVPTFNEERRIENILKCYAQEFDVVLLDDGSTDATVAIAIRAGATVFTRIGEAVGENHFVYYVNQVTKSGYCFYLMADEFIKKVDLHAAFAALHAQPCVVFGRRVDWAFGRQIVSQYSKSPRGLCKGSAIYNPNRLHSSLEYTQNPSPRILEFDVHHFQLLSMKSYFGRVGTYAYREVEQFRRQKHPLLRFIKRFVLFELRRLPSIIWGERKKGFAFLVWVIGLSVSQFPIAVMCWMEQRYLMSPEEQLETYARFYL